jgi:hypothetical protein
MGIVVIVRECIPVTFSTKSFHFLCVKRKVGQLKAYTDDKTWIPLEP